MLREIGIGRLIQPARRLHQFAALNRLRENLPGIFQPAQILRAHDLGPGELKNRGCVTIHATKVPYVTTCLQVVAFCIFGSKAGRFEGALPGFVDWLDS